MSTSDTSRTEGTIRFNWLKTMYGANVGISGGLGLATLLVPDTVRAVLGLPPQDPIHFGIAAGAVPLAFGLAGLWGLRSPLMAAPVLVLQVLYKGLFLVAVALPLAWAGQFPEHALPVVAIFVFFIAGNLIAVPFSYLQRQPSESLSPSTKGG